MRTRVLDVQKIVQPLRVSAASIVRKVAEPAIFQPAVRRDEVGEPQHRLPAVAMQLVEKAHGVGIGVGIEAHRPMIEHPSPIDHVHAAGEVVGDDLVGIRLADRLVDAAQIHFDPVVELGLHEELFRRRHARKREVLPAGVEVGFLERLARDNGPDLLHPRHDVQRSRIEAIAERPIAPHVPTLVRKQERHRRAAPALHRQIVIGLAVTFVQGHGLRVVGLFVAKVHGTTKPPFAVEKSDRRLVRFLARGARGRAQQTRGAKNACTRQQESPSRCGG